MRYDYLIVGAGLYGATFAQMATEAGMKCLVIDRRPHIGGNCHCEEIEGILVHRYGPHIFHTSDEEVWRYVNRFAEFNGFINSPMAYYKDNEVYSLPFTMHTFSKMWGVAAPWQAKPIIERQIASLNIGEPRNLEEQALKMVGTDVYEKLVKGYTEKQWGRPCSELPAFIIKRLPLRFTYDNRYFSDPHQGIPVKGYDDMISKMLQGCEVLLGTEYEDFIVNNPMIAGKTVYTGMIDQFFGYEYGPLAYRSLKFETIVVDIPNYQGVAVMNYTSADVPYTRMIEHKHFAFGTQPKSVITKETPQTWEPGMEPYYPIEDEENKAKLSLYQQLAAGREYVIFGGRLGSYRYFDMDKTIRAAMDTARAEIKRRKGEVS